MKLYISDLDGTLLNHEKEISDYTKATLNHLIAGGLIFTIATARTAASAVKILAGLNLNLPVVLMNGVVIYDLNRNKYLKTETLSEETAQAIIRILKEHRAAGFMYGISGNQLTTYYESLNTPALQDFYQERIRKYYKSFAQTDSFFNVISGNQIIYFALIDEEKPLSIIYAALKNLPEIDLTIYHDIYAANQWYLEIFSKTASKYNAVKYLRELYHFERIIGFGDNFNDIPLFAACDECYAVSNAVAPLKEKATGVIGANDEDGVARFLATFFQHRGIHGKYVE